MELIDKIIAFENKYNSVVPDKDGLAEFLVENDAVEVVHARWVRYEHGSGIYCSHCRHKRRYKDANDNYCPNCGAKMDGDGNG